MKGDLEWWRRGRLGRERVASCAHAPYLDPVATTPKGHRLYRCPRCGGWVWQMGEFWGRFFWAPHPDAYPRGE